MVGLEIQDARYYTTGTNGGLMGHSNIENLSAAIRTGGTLSIITGGLGSGHTNFSFLLIDKAMQVDPELHLILTTSHLPFTELSRWGPCRVHQCPTATSLLLEMVEMHAHKRPAIIFVESAGFTFNFQFKSKIFGNFLPLYPLVRWIQGTQISLVLDASHLIDIMAHWRAGMVRLTKVNYGLVAEKLSLKSVRVYENAAGVLPGTIYHHLPPAQVRYGSSIPGAIRVDIDFLALDSLIGTGGKKWPPHNFPV